MAILAPEMIEASGDVFGDILTEAGVSQGRFHFGNATMFSMQPNSEIKEYLSNGRDTYGNVLATTARKQAFKLKATFNQFHAKTFALQFLGDDYVISTTGSTVSAETVVAIHDFFVDLAHRGVSSVVVNRKDGSTAAVWQATTAYAVNDYVVPVTANGHFYKCTDDGTSGGTEPTWLVAGTEQTDGTAKWTDQGHILCVNTTDYEISPNLGFLKAHSTGIILDGEDLSVAYTYASEAGYKIYGATKPTIRCSFILDGKNLTNGDKIIMTVYHVQVKPTEAIDFLANDAVKMSMEGTPITPYGYTHPFKLEVFS